MNCLGLELIVIGTRLCFGQDVETPRQSTVVVCAPILEWTEADQKAAEQKLRALPKGDPLRKMGVLYVRQRDVNRRCFTERTNLKTK